MHQLIVKKCPIVIKFKPLTNQIKIAGAQNVLEEGVIAAKDFLENGFADLYSVPILPEYSSLLSMHFQDEIQSSVPGSTILFSPSSKKMSARMTNTAGSARNERI